MALASFEGSNCLARLLPRLRPRFTERPGIPEGERVQITVETFMGPGTEDPLELAANVYRGLRPEEIDDIERIALDRSH